MQLLDNFLFQHIQIFIRWDRLPINERHGERSTEIQERDSWYLLFLHHFCLRCILPYSQACE